MWWEMDRWEIKAAAGSRQEEREGWRRDNWKRRDGQRARLHPEGKRSGVEGCKRGAGRVGVGAGAGAGAPRQVSECKRRNTQTSVCKTDSQTDRIH